MRMVLIAIATALIAPSAWAQSNAPAPGAESLDDMRTNCISDNPDVSIAACTADIRSGQETANILPLAYYNRALSYFKKHLYDQAIADESEAIALNPDYFQAYFNRGFIYEQLGKRDLALADYSAALKISPDDADVKSALKRLGVAP